MRTVGKHINLKGNVPSTVEEMKAGEIRATEEGMYARVGDQVLFEGWDIHYLPTTSTTTTTTTTGAWIENFFYDDFNDASIHANWTQVTDGTIDESGGELTFTTNADGSQEIYQTLDSHLVIFDVWGEMETDSVVIDINARFKWQQDGPQAKYMQLEIEEDEGKTLWCKSLNTGSTPGENSVGMGGDSMYVRIRYRPDLGDTYVRAYYSTTLPTQDIDWTEITPATQRAVPDVAGTLFTFRLQSNNTNGANPHDDIFYDAIEWSP